MNETLQAENQIKQQITTSQDKNKDKIVYFEKTNCVPHAGFSYPRYSELNLRYNTKTCEMHSYKKCVKTAIVPDRKYTPSKKE